MITRYLFLNEKKICFRTTGKYKTIIGLTKFTLRRTSAVRVSACAASEPPRSSTFRRGYPFWKISAAACRCRYGHPVILCRRRCVAGPLPRCSLAYHADLCRFLKSPTKLDARFIIIGVILLLSLLKMIKKKTIYYNNNQYWQLPVSSVGGARVDGGESPTGGVRRG